MTDPQDSSEPRLVVPGDAEAVPRALHRALLDHPFHGRLFIAYSGGPDSTALLHAAAQSLPDRVVALHANHGLQADATRWVQHCEQHCARWHVPLRSARLQIENRGRGLEAAAREARYAWFRDSLETGDVLLLAQHRDDQAETVLLRLLRGAGPEGLAGMPMARALGAGHLLRPFLNLSRSTLLAYNAAHGLEAVDDPSNRDMQHDRSFLRQEILPRLATRWPAYAERFASAADLLREQGALVDVPPLEAIRSAVGDPGFALATLPQDDVAAAFAVRRWLRERDLLVPSRTRLVEFLRQLREASGARLETEAWCLERYRDDVFVYQPAPRSWERRPRRIDASGRFKVPAVGVLTVLGPVDETALKLRFRQAGDAIASANGGRKTLKNLFQERAVPTWWRERVPLLTRVTESSEEVLCVGELASSPAARELGVALRWEPEVLGGAS